MEDGQRRWKDKDKEGERVEGSGKQEDRQVYGERGRIQEMEAEQTKESRVRGEGRKQKNLGMEDGKEKENEKEKKLG